MFHRIYAIIKKELKQVRRDLRTLLIVFFFPIFMLILFGYALNFDVNHIKIGVFDQDRSPLSREFIHSLSSSGYFDVEKYFTDSDEINSALDRKDVQCVVVIPKDLSDKFYSKQDAKIQYLVDGVDGNTATVVMNYLNIATRNLSQNYQKEFLARSGIKIYTPVELVPVFWFNPELKTTQFLVPGLIASLLMTLSVVLTAIAIVREKELGTIEQINVSPVTPIELLLGKIIPYAILSLLIAFLIIIAGYFLFSVPINGSILLLFLTILLYLFSGLSIGILVSAISDSQQVAFQIGLLFSQLPSQLLSGFIFPIESMPPAVQVLTNITPAKFFLVAIRSILIKGTGIEAYWDQLVYLLIFIAVFLLLATIKMKRTKLQ
ncbi:MAG: ABC transporter permease [Ignavibacteriae bacterium]|nr:MAG: ABC transporter permease [Ignavibacteriota bacterium]